MNESKNQQIPFQNFKLSLMFSIRKEKSPILYLFFFTERNERERSKN
jgi:hypothetical protein